MKVFDQSIHSSALDVRCCALLLFVFVGHSLVAPVQSHSDVSFDLTGLVLGQVTLDQLPPEVHQLVHHMAQLMEQVHLVFLRRDQRPGLERQLLEQAPRITSIWITRL